MLIDPRLGFVRPLPASEGGGWIATDPELPGCTGTGVTEAAALADLAEARLEWLDEARRLGRMH